MLRKTLCEHVNGLCPAGKLNEQSIIQPWFQSVHTCPYGWATGCNNILPFLKDRSGWGTVDRVWRVASGEHEQSSRQAPLGVWRPVLVQGRRYQSLLGTYGVFPVRPVGRCEGLIQLAHGDNAWPIAANAAIRAYLHPNEFGLS